MSSNDAAIGVSVATVVLLTVLIVALVVAADRQGQEAALPYIPVQAGDDGLAGSGVAAAAGPGTRVSTRLKVIPLTWSPAGSLYTVTFTVGTDVVEAAFDTGSARFIVATSSCTGCGLSLIHI